MGIEIALAQAALNDTATVDFTSTKLSAAPVGVFAMVSEGATNGTAADGWNWGYGFTDGTTDVGVSVEAVSGAADEDVFRESSATYIARRDPTEVNSGDQIDHNSFLSNGWRADHTRRSNEGRLALAAMFGGSDVAVESGTSPVGDGTQQTVTLTDTTLTPTVILFSSVGSDDGNSGTFFTPSFGIAHWDGTTLTQRGYIASIGDGSASGDPNARIDTGAVAGQGTFWELAVDSVSQGQFQYTATANSGSDKVHWIAIQLTNANAALVDIDMPTATGLNEQTGPGFQPKFVMAVQTMLTAVDTWKSDSTAGALNFSLFNDTEAFSYSWADEDAAATINTQSMTHDRPVYYAADSGALAFDATFSQFTANGWELNYGTVDATVRKGFALAIGEASSGISGTADQTLPAVTQTASGTLTFTASADQTFASLTQSASGSTTGAVSGSAAQTLPSITQDSAGSLQFSGTSSQLMAAITQSASGGLTFTGSAAQTLSSIIQSASGTTDASRSGSITQTLPVVTQDSTGTLTFTATDGGQELPAVTQTAQETIKDVRPQGSKFYRSGVRTTFRRSHYRSKR